VTLIKSITNLSGN